MSMIDALAKTGTPPTILAPLRSMESDESRVHGERYSLAREREEVAGIHRRTAEQLAQQMLSMEREADAERDAELKRLDAETAQRRSVPVKRVDETDSEYATRLHRRGIEESQRVASLLVAVADVQAISMASDPDVIMSAVDEAMASATPEAISRIGRAALARLGVLAAEESKNGTLGPAFAADTMLKDRMRKWRAETATQSLDAKRDKVLARHTARVADARNAVLGAARVYRIEQLVTQAAMRASVIAKTAQ